MSVEKYQDYPPKANPTTDADRYSAESQEAISLAGISQGLVNLTSTAQQTSLKVTALEGRLPACATTTPGVFVLVATVDEDEAVTYEWRNTANSSVTPTPETEE